jgi:hypothetical protein
MLKSDLKNSVLKLDRKVAKKERENLMTTDYPVGKGRRGRPPITTMPVYDDVIFHPDHRKSQPPTMEGMGQHCPSCKGRGFRKGTKKLLDDLASHGLSVEDEVMVKPRQRRVKGGDLSGGFGFDLFGKIKSAIKNKLITPGLDAISGAFPGTAIPREAIRQVLGAGGRKPQHGNKGRAGNKWIQFLKKEGYLQKGKDTGICLPKKGTEEYETLMKKYKTEPAKRKRKVIRRKKVS